MKLEETNYDTLRAKYGTPPSSELQKEDSVDKTGNNKPEHIRPESNTTEVDNATITETNLPNENSESDRCMNIQPDIDDEQTEKNRIDKAANQEISPCKTESLQSNTHSNATESVNLNSPVEKNAPHEPEVDLPQIIKMLNEQSAAITAMNQRLSALTNAFIKVQQLPAQVDELSKAAARQEKANVDILRDSKNYQATVREQMQQELERYRKLHADTAYAPILMEVANLYISTEKIIAFIQDEKLKTQLTEMLLENMEELLEDQGVVIHTTPVGEKRSLKTCKTRKTIPTNNKDLHGLVAASNNPSFEFHNLVLIKESVDTYIYDESLDTMATRTTESVQTYEEVLETVTPIDVHQEETLL